ncbi:hypothetical protein NBRC10513v2_000107 [Rhodotorula toruloides]
MPDLAVSDDDTHLYGQTFGGDRQSKLTKRETLCAQDAAIKAAWLNFFARCAPGLYRLDILADDDDGHDYQGKDPLGRSRGKYALEHLQLESLPVLGALSSLHIGIYKGLRLEPFFKHGHLFPSLEILAFHHTERAPNKPWVVTREQGNKFMHPRTVQILGLPKGLTFGTRTSSGRTLHPSPRASPVSSSKAGPSQRAPTFTPIWMPCFPKSRLPAPQLALDQDASLWREPQTLHGALSTRTALGSTPTDDTYQPSDDDAESGSSDDALAPDMSNSKPWWWIGGEREDLMERFLDVLQPDERRLWGIEE